MGKSMNQIDYVCKVGERVFFKNLKNEKFECVILKWDSNIATVVLDDGTEKIIKC